MAALTTPTANTVATSQGVEPTALPSSGKGSWSWPN